MGFGLILLVIIVLLGIFLLTFVVGGYNTLVTVFNLKMKVFYLFLVKIMWLYDLFPNLF
jgi:hypothetical protein